MSDATQVTPVVDLAVVGGGIVGLATAREFLRRRPGLNVIVIEKEDLLAQHQTGRNSGVIHAGIYYAPGSVKARACVQGRAQIVQYCQERGIKIALTGKLIVAVDDSERPRLQQLWERATRNGVPGVERVGPEQMRAIEPYVTGVEAIWSPHTGIVDWGEVARAFAEDVREAGGSIRTGCKVVAIRPMAQEVVLGLHSHHQGTQGDIRARYVVTCGGLYADRLTHMSERHSPIQIVPFRGTYYRLHDDRAGLCRSMIYPVPDPAFPFLGVHLTRSIDGGVWAGPNAVLALGRESYRRADVHLGELAETLLYPGFWRLAARYLKTGLDEMVRDAFKAAYVRRLQRYTPDITAADLVEMACGIRAQALTPQGALVDDFLVAHGQRVTHVQNAPSPAATSSLMIARMIADEVEQRGELPARIIMPAAASQMA